MMTDKPKFENLTNNKTMEFGLSCELTEIATILQTTAQKVLEVDSEMIIKMKQNSLTWEEVANQLEKLSSIIKHRTDYILEKFDS